MKTHTRSDEIITPARPTPPAHQHAASMMRASAILVYLLPACLGFTMMQPVRHRVSVRSAVQMNAAEAAAKVPDVAPPEVLLQPEPEPEPEPEAVAVEAFEPEPPEEYVRPSGVRIRPGDELPDVIVEPASRAKEARGKAYPKSIRDALGGGRTILVGMPGAFTPTCTDKHLPGFLAAQDRLAALNVSQVAVVTTNDRFVNQGWADSVAACCGSNASGVLMLSDTKGELIDDIGLAGETGFGLEKRSKRFAIVLEDSVVQYVAVDEGRDALDSTSAKAMIRYLDPSAPGDGLSPSAVGAVGALGLLAAAFVALNSGGGGDIAPVAVDLGLPSETELAAMSEDERAVALEKKAVAQAAQAEAKAAKSQAKAAAEAAKAEAAKQKAEEKAAALAAKAEAKAAAEAAKAEAAKQKAEEKAAAEAAKAEAKAAAEAAKAEARAAAEAAKAQERAAAEAAKAKAAAGRKAEEEAAAEAARAAIKQRAEAKAAAEAAKAEAQAVAAEQKAQERAAAEAAKAEAAKERAAAKAAAEAAKAESKAAAEAAKVEAAMPKAAAVE